jgi:hypothetical protein
MTNDIHVTLESGPKGKKVVAVAPEWPGLARGAKSEEAALERLRAYLPLYGLTSIAPCPKRPLSAWWNVISPRIGRFRKIDLMPDSVLDEAWPDDPAVVGCERFENARLYK